METEGAGLCRDGLQLDGRGAILHLFPPPMISDERLLTLLLMKKALIDLGVEALLRM